MTTKTKKIILVLLTTLITLIAYVSFFKFHLVSDTYRIVDNTTSYMINLKFNEGRLVQVLYFVILNIFGISINSINMYMFLYRINLTISIMLIIISILFTYKLLINNIKNITSRKKFIVFLSTLLIFINITICDYTLFIENFIMILGLFLSVLATHIYISNKKFKLPMTLILLLISSFCYQGVPQLFVILSSLVVLMNKSNNEKTNILKELFKIFLLYLIPLIINYLICWWLNSILPNLDPRVFTGVMQSLKHVFSLGNIVILFMYMFILGFFILFNTMSFMFEKPKKALIVLLHLIILAVISMSSFIIFLFNTSSGLTTRIMLNFIIIYPIFKIYILSVTPNTKHIADVIILLIVNILLLFNLQFVSINSTTKNIDFIESIITEINRYENKNNIEIKNIAFYEDACYSSSDYWNTKSNLYLVYAYPLSYGYWSDIYSMNVLSGRKFNKLNYSEIDMEIKKYFNQKNWHEPNLKEQLIFKGDTVHICTF